MNRGTLSSGTIADGSATFTQNWSGLDPLGNWASFVQDDDGGGSGSAVTQTRTHNRTNEITAISGNSPDWIDPAHDPAGNMTAGPAPGSPATRQHYVYDAWNKLVKVKADSGGSPGSDIVAYEHDALNRRVQRTAGGATTDLYYSSRWQVLEERVSGTAKAQYVWSLGYVDELVLRDRDGSRKRSRKRKPKT